MSDHYIELPPSLFDQYQDCKADLVALSMNLADALANENQWSIDYYHRHIRITAARITQLRADMEAAAATRPPAGE